MQNYSSLLAKEMALDKKPCQDDYIIIDSADRDFNLYPNPAEYVVRPISELRSVDTMEIMAMQLVRAEPNVHSGNSTFTVTIGSTTSTVSLSVGEVDVPTSLATNLQTALRTVNSNFSVAYNSSTYRLTITNSATEFTLSFSESVSRLLGLNGKKERGSGDLASVLVSGVHTVYGTRAVYLLGEPYISFYLNDYDRMNSAGSLSDGSYLTIPLEGRKFMERFLLANDEKEKKGIYILQGNQRNVNQIRIRFTRPDGSLYDFNGMDHIIVLRITRRECKDYS